MTDMNVYAMQRLLKCQHDTQPTHRIVTDERPSKNIFKDNIQLDVTYARNLSKQRRDIPNAQLVAAKISTLFDALQNPEHVEEHEDCGNACAV